MKRKISVIIPIIIFLILNVSACSSNDSVLQTLKQDNEIMKSSNLKLYTQIAELKTENETLKKENDELKNGAGRTLNEIQDAFGKKNYDTVITLSKQLSDNHPGSKEVIEANKLIVQIESIKKEEQKKADTETAKAKEEAEKGAKGKAREIIRVKSVYPSEPNSAGGVDLYIVWQNKSSKIIKYAYFEVEPYNAVGDVVSCSISGNSTFRGQETGPIKQNQWRDDGRYWECAWYNNTITKVKLLQVDIEYMDGSNVSLTGNDIDYVRY